MDLGVYVSSHNEEYLIRPCIQAILKEFPQVELIDLGSKDATLDNISDLNIPIHRFEGVSGPGWTKLKNEFSAKHDWVFWVDGDEIYERAALLTVKEKINSEKYSAYRIAWRYFLKENGTVIYSDDVVNGCKIFDSERYLYRKPWPAEVLDSNPEYPMNKEGTDEATIWCWHGKMLKRSPLPETKTRAGKKTGYLENLKEREIKWRPLGTILPWMSDNLFEEII